ncbi:hypothetical protein [Paraburkholderia sp. A3RO-2L]|uniref:hypothetical protein n=1 Tax=Paraburkholderia sp. A3RO-2L TaxID=3028376 RepID=UPI003DA97293
MQTEQSSGRIDYRYDDPESDLVVRGVALEATRVLRKGKESHPAITDEATVQQFIRASIEVGFITADDVAAGRVEVTVEMMETSDKPWDVYVIFNGTDCIFFEPIC